MEDNTKKMLEFFYEISQIPRESGNEEQIANYLEEFAKKRGLECYRDKLNNVLIKKINTDAKDTLVLQAHTDMVCVKNENSNHNFKVDPIEIVCDEDVITAKDTTLGADDGIGVAIILFLLDNKELTTVNLECLFTTKEETTFEGASSFNYSKLSSKKLVNFDGCEDDAIVTACDGDYAIRYTAKFKQEISNKPLYRVKISNLKGGNSGIEIGKDRISAIILMAKILEDLEDACVSSINGGTAELNIATDCECIIATDNINKILGCRYEFDNEFPIVTASRIEDTEYKVFSKEDSMKIVNEILNLKQDIITGSKEKIITFGNIGKIITNENKVVLETLVAGNSYEDLEKSVNENNYISKVNGFENEEIYNDSIWKEKEESDLKERYAQAYYKINGDLPKIKGSHGLLECSCFANAIPNVDMISIGTIIEDFHTTNEKIYVSSCEKTINVILQFIKDFDN